MNPPTEKSRERHGRQVLLPGFGQEGQRKINDSTVAVLGCGATGGVLAQWLARAGVGRLVLVDRDLVEESNLQRQILFDQDDLDLPKAVCAKRRLAAIDRDLQITPHVIDVNPETIDSVLDAVDLVVDGSDNFPLRLLLNDWAIKNKRPWVFTGAVRFVGQSALFRPGFACFRCLIPEAPPPGSLPTCDTAGVFGPSVGVVASLSAGKALRWLVGHVEATKTQVDSFDFASSQIHRSFLKPDPACRACAGEWDFLKAPLSKLATRLCGRQSVQVSGGPLGCDLAELAKNLEPLGKVELRPFFLRFSTEKRTLTIFPDGRTVIAGTTEVNEALSLYARYLGH